MGCNLSTFFSNRNNNLEAPCSLECKLYHNTLQNDGSFFTHTHHTTTLFRNELVQFIFYVGSLFVDSDEERKLEICGSARYFLHSTKLLHCWIYVYLTLLPANVSVDASDKCDEENTEMKEAREISMVLHFQGKKLQWTTLDLFPSVQYLCDVRNGYLSTNAEKTLEKFVMLRFQISIQEKPFDLSVMPQPSEMFTEHYVLK